MGCECAFSSEEPKNELSDLNSKEIIENKSKINDNIFGSHLKSSISDSINNNLQSMEIKSSVLNENNQPIENNSNQLYENYSQKMFELINKIRENPNLYADIIENSIENIREEISKNDGSNKIVYKDKVKVALNRGEIAFREAANELRTYKPIPPISFKNEICIPLPSNEEEIKNSNYLKEQVKLFRENNNIDVFYKDLIKDPEVSALLMIVDDSIKNPGKKRQAVLDKNFKFVGISSGFIGKNFVAYFTFSK